MRANWRTSSARGSSEPPKRQGQAHVRHVELQDVRLAPHALNGKDDDADTDKRTLVENGHGVVIDTDLRRVVVLSR
jgi:hypothetical protein